jgi:hypothetical protein
VRIPSTANEGEGQAGEAVEESEGGDGGGMGTEALMSHVRHPPITCGRPHDDWQGGMQGCGEGGAGAGPPLNCKVGAANACRHHLQVSLLRMGEVDGWGRAGLFSGDNPFLPPSVTVKLGFLPLKCRSYVKVPPPPVSSAAVNSQLRGGG